MQHISRIILKTSSKNLQVTLVDMDETYFISLLFRFIYFFPKNWFSSYPVLLELAPVSRCFFQAHCSSRKVGKTIVNGTRLAMFSARFKKASRKHRQPGAMSRFQFDMGTSAMAEPKFGFHGEALRLRSFDGGSRCKRRCICPV